jgi:hypothetical protein
MVLVLVLVALHVVVLLHRIPDGEFVEYKP